jgi:hypothetical protein
LRRAGFFDAMRLLLAHLLSQQVEQRARDQSRE